jgi:hypothetical protein
MHFVRRETTALCAFSFRVQHSMAKGLTVPLRLLWAFSGNGSRRQKLEPIRRKRTLRAQITAEVEKSQADRAEQDLDRERSRARELQNRLDIALQVTHAPRRAEDARRAVGRWARLRSAWQGERAGWL